MPVVLVFSRLRTQWHHGMAGRTGLRYPSAYPLLDRLHPSDPDAWDEALDDLQTMERAALDLFDELTED
ncbi:MAG: Phage related hypothetical protein [Pseudomonadota bacterium]|jgi:hypothetical protein